MKIQSSLTPLNFGKTLQAKAGYIDNGTSTPCYIYKLDAKEDKDYFQNLKTNPDWEGNHFLDRFEECLLDCVETESTYTLENKEGNCLGLINIDSLCNRWSDINFVETCPQYAKKKSPRFTKYIGETLLSFATAKSKSENNNYLAILSPRKEVKGFYTKNCGFKQGDNPLLPYRLNPEDYDKLIEQNALHTGIRMEYKA